jgi:hypothetical protein
MVDTYYYGESNLEKQAYPAVVNTRFVQNFTNLGAGSSQFVISPQGGVSDIIAQFVTPAVSGANYTTLALNQGWGYALIARLSVRYGSSAQYFFSGAQMYLQNLIDAENTQKAVDISTLGGNALAGASCANASAYVYIKLPHNSVRASGKPLPFPSDLLVQPIVITIELLAFNQVLVNQSATANLNLTAGSSALAAAQLQVKQEMMTDSSDLLARRVDMNSHAYTLPLMYFAQQETQVQVTSTSNITDILSVNLTGFRAGEVKSIVLWLTTAANSSPGNGNYDPLRFQPINGVTLTYNGEIFSRFDVGSAALWNLTCDEKTQTLPAYNYQASGSVATATQSTPWVDCPFAQVCVPYDKEMKLIHGKPILNAVVNLQFQAPVASTAYVLHAMYLYNASLLCSRGSAEYIF